MVLMLIASCGSNEVDSELEPYLVKAREQLQQSAEQLHARWGRPLAPDWGRLDGESWFFDDDQAKLYWLEKTKAVLVADVSLVGTYEYDPKAPKDKPDEAGSFRWSWDNDTVADASKKRVEAVRRWGAARRSAKVSKGAWIGPPSWGVDMLAAAVRVTGSSGGYMRSSGNLDFYFLLHSIRKPSETELHPDLSATKRTDASNEKK
ncbi:MAG: hypothetical protein KDC95_14635 [Planctomycetes bacterium]|nr:hypothetical protein [Planctomycetota bacterium]